MTSPPVPPVPDLDPAIDRFWETIPPLWHRVRAYIRETAAQKHAISVEQFHILRHIRRGVTSVSELADAKHISRSAISQAVDVLVQRGMITRCQDAHDRRYIQLALTPAGSALLDAIFQDTRAWMRSRLARLSSEELKQIEDALNNLSRAFADPLP